MLAKSYIAVVKKWVTFFISSGQLLRSIAQAIKVVLDLWIL